MSTFERLYAGDVYEIWITKQDGNSQVMEYGRGLPTSTHNRLRNILERTADEGKYTNIEVYRSLGEGIYEFKAHIARVYSFDDSRRIILSHGADRPKNHAGVIRERKIALKTFAEYLEWKRTGN